MDYQQMIQTLKGLDNNEAQINFLFSYLLQNCEYDYLYLEIEKLKKLDVNTFADLYDEDLFEQALQKLKKETAISNELEHYFKTHQWERRSYGELDLQFKDGIITKGVCKDYTNFILKVLTEIGIECKICAGKTPLNHIWLIITTYNNTLHYDITYAMYARDKKSKNSTPKDWLGISTKRLLELQPNRIITTPQNGDDGFIMNK